MSLSELFCFPVHHLYSSPLGAQVLIYFCTATSFHCVHVVIAFIIQRRFFFLISWVHHLSRAYQYTIYAIPREPSTHDPQMQSFSVRALDVLFRNHQRFLKCYRSMSECIEQKVDVICTVADCLRLILTSFPGAHCTSETENIPLRTSRLSLVWCVGPEGLWPGNVSRSIYVDKLHLG